MKKFSSGVAVDFFETLDSTSLEAKRRAAAGEKGPRWFIAENQTAGYGRRARAWTQATGDFSGSLLLNPETTRDLGQISFVVALAVASALDELIKPEKISFKWPNDVLIDGAKAAGILLEHLGPQRSPVLAIGIGVNVVSAPTDVPYEATRLVNHSATTPSPTDLGARIDHHFWVYLKDWRTNGFANIRELWLSRARGIGDKITVRLPDGEHAGVFDGLDENGALILRSGEEKRIISAGDVYFGMV